MPATPDELFFAGLDPFEIDALIILGLYFAPQSATVWSEWFHENSGLERPVTGSKGRKKKGSKPPPVIEGLSALGQRLSERGLVDIDDPARVASYSLKLDLYVPLLAAAEERGRLAPVWRSMQASVSGSSSRIHHRIRYRMHGQGPRLALAGAALRVALTRGQLDDLGELLHQIERNAYEGLGVALLDVLGSHPLPHWIEALPDAMVERYVGALLEHGLASLERPADDLAAWVERSAKPKRLELARLFALRGDHEALEALAKLPRWGPQTVELLAHFAAGDYERAAEVGDALVATMSARKFKQLRGIEGVVHALARIVTMAAHPARAAALDESVDHWHLARAGHDLAGQMLSDFTRFVRQPTPPTHPPLGLREPVHTLAWPELLVECLCVHWLGLPLVDHVPGAALWLAAWAKRAKDMGCPGLAREFSALVAICAGQPAPTPSLAAAYARREGWERVLEAIESSAERVRLGTEERASQDDGFRPHLVWELELHEEHVSIKPKLMSSARSKKGKAVALSTLLSAKADYLSDADRRVLAAVETYEFGWRREVHHELGWAALVALIDHPHVRRASRAPLRVVRGQAKIRSQTKAGITSLTLEPALLARQAIVQRPRGDDVVEVFERDLELAALYEMFAQSEVLKIPASGRGRLLDGLAGLATSAAIQIEGERALESEIVEADPSVVMELGWDGAMFVADAKVAPLGPEGPKLRPGEGPVQMVGRVGDGLRGCTRDLAAEADRLAELLDACPCLASSTATPGHWQINELELALEILLELGARGDALTLTWPAGRRLAPPRLLSADALNISVETKRDWLAVDVELPMDEGLVLGFEQLLARRHGRFVVLDDDRIVALTAALRARVEALEQLGAIKRGKLQAHPVTLPLIAELVDAPEQLQADRKSRARMVQLDAIAAKTPRRPRGLHAILRDYQVEGFRWMARLAEAGLGAVLADDMGLGKTIQALALLCQRAKLGPALVVAPTSVVDNWQAEVDRFAPGLRCESLAAASDRAASLASLRPGSVLLCSYGLLVSEAEALARPGFSTVVFDEAHALKNPRSKRARAAMALTSEFRLGLTGTPVENHLGELWSVMQATVPGLLGPQKRFDERFARPIAQGQRDRARLLRTMLAPFILRRTKAQVLDELPARTEITIRVRPSAKERAFYEALRREALDRTEGLAGGGGRLQILAEITKLRQAAVDPRLIDPDHGPASAKLDALLERLVELQAEGHRALVFTQFLGSLAAIRGRLDAAGIEHLGFEGSTPARQRTAAIEAFQAGDADVFLMSLKAGGVGINLTAADYVIHVDPWWNPAVEDQATGRAHRIGQQRPVTVYRLVTVGTIEERILELHGTKRDLADDLLAGLDSTKALDLDELRALLLEP